VKILHRTELQFEYSFIYAFCRLPHAREVLKGKSGAINSSFNFFYIDISTRFHLNCL
jgi:hypothetical protein